MLEDARMNNVGDNHGFTKSNGINWGEKKHNN